jgi:hypothetical protein
VHRVRAYYAPGPAARRPFGLGAAGSGPGPADVSADVDVRVDQLKPIEPSGRIGLVRFQGL